MIIKFQIIKSVVKEAVQGATYLKGQLDNSASNAGDKTVLAESMGEDATHGKSFSHDFDTALEILKTFFVDYLTPTPQTIGDNAIYYNDIKDDVVEFTLSVSARFNGTLTDALARLSAKYVEDYIIYQWWQKLGLLKNADPYFASLQVDEAHIRKCFILTAPTVPESTFSTTLSIVTSGEDADGAVPLIMGESSTLTYVLSDGAVDDIEARSDDPHIVRVSRSHQKGMFVLLPKDIGFTTVKIFSRHNEDLEKEVFVKVKER